ncbi:MAG: hypothetical protein KatS3mg087_0114 [Patescibacteria group bacterium]|nr:MAG: hypothetical protein KatS3mg087_0114 [Patescibacteria group bacterium]
MFDIKIACTESQLLEAGKLVYEQYSSNSLISENPSAIYISPWMKIPESRVILAYKDGKLIYTATIVPDGKFGLPSDIDFPEHLNFLRTQHEKLCEVTGLAGRYVSFKLFIRFCGVLHNHIVDIGATPILVCHPKHEDYYRNIWGFRRVAFKDKILRAQNNPGSLMIQDSKNVPEVGIRIAKEMQQVLSNS